MAEGMSSYTATAVLNAIGNNTSFSVSANPWLQLHTAAPGAAGTTAIASETDRMQVSFGATGGTGSITNDAAITWTNITGSEDATHWTLWDAQTNGNFLWSGAITANPYVAGNTLNFAASAFTLSFTVGSATSAVFADAILNAVCNNTALAVTTLYGKLYIGDPGATGVSNAATETTRKALPFGTASAASMASDGAVTWTNISATGTEDATFLGLWTDVSAGSYYGSVAINAPSYGNGDTYDIASGALTLSFTAAS